MLLVLPSAALAADIDSSTIVAEWDGGKITVADYVGWWNRMSDEEKPDLIELDAKVELLESIVNAKIMLQEAKAAGEDKHPNVVEWLTNRRSNILRERLYQQATEGRLTVDEDEVQKLYERRLTQISASHIIVPTHGQARAIADSLAVGVPFEHLAHNYSTCPSGARGGSLGVVRWGDFSERWSAEAFSLEPSEVSQPFPVESGYAIVKVDHKTLLEPEDPEAEKGGIRAGLLKQKNFAERAVFLDSLKAAYGVDIDMGAVVDLCARFAQVLVDRGITSEVVAQDIVPALTDAEKEMSVVTFEGGSFSYGDVVGMILAQPYLVRPKLDEPDEIYTFVNRQLSDTLTIREAEKRGIDELPEVAGMLDKIAQNRVIMRFYRVIVADTEVPEDSLRAFYNAHRDAYVTTPAHWAFKIVVETRAEADSILEAIRGGESFEEIARQHSIDRFTAPAGGDMGVYPVGKDVEFDAFFEEMEEGEMKIFRSVEGHVVLWLRDRQEVQPLSFERAKPAVRKDIARRFKDARLKDWLTDKREELGLKTYMTPLEGLALSSR
jgi:parvulin-like peptidyl-prolyl isomerase